MIQGVSGSESFLSLFAFILDWAVLDGLVGSMEIGTPSDRLPISLTPLGGASNWLPRKIYVLKHIIYT